MKKQQAGFSFVKGVIIVAVAAVTVAAIWLLNSRKSSDTKRVVQEYNSQADCEAATGSECRFAMCDYVPEGKTYEEVCGDSPKGWRPVSTKN